MHMQAVDKKWYLAYRWGALAATFLVLIFSFALWFTPAILPFGKTLHIGYFTAVVILIQVVYTVAAYDRIAERRSHAEAMVILAMIQATTIFCLLQTTGRMTSPFMVWWGIACFMSGMFGIYASAGTAFISTIYF